MARRHRASAIAVSALGKARNRIEPSASLVPKRLIQTESDDALVGIKECRKLTGLFSRELLLGIGPSRAHHATLKGYLRSFDRDVLNVWDALIRDLRGYLDIGARCCAADQLIAPRLFLAGAPRGRRSKAPVSLLKEEATRAGSEQIES